MGIHLATLLNNNRALPEIMTYIQCTEGSSFLNYLFDHDGCEPSWSDDCSSPSIRVMYLDIYKGMSHKYLCTMMRCRFIGLRAGGFLRGVGVPS